MGKRKQEEEYESEGSEEEEKPKPKKKAAPRKSKVPAEPYTSPRGWNVEPPSLIWKDFGSEPCDKIAAFDLDGTLVNTKSGARFPRHAGDYKWFNKKVPKKLGELQEEGYKIVLFTNQGSIKSKLDGKAAENVENRIGLIAHKLQEDVGLHPQVFIAPSMDPGDTCRKPAPGMWAYMVAHCNGGISPDLSSSFFVGDADGSQGTHGDGDKKFAEAVGLKFKLPEEVFGPMEGKAALDTEEVKAAMQEVEAGSHPNAELIQQFTDLAKAAFDSSDTFKGVAYQKVAKALATFTPKVAESNLKEVGKLAGVGKGSIERMKLYLKYGNIQGEEAAGEAAAAEQEKVTKFAKSTEAALKFM